jgi:hypothetical protein
MKLGLAKCPRLRRGKKVPERTTAPDYVVQAGVRPDGLTPLLVGMKNKS